MVAEQWDVTNTTIKLLLKIAKMTNFVMCSLQTTNEQTKTPLSTNTATLIGYWRNYQL